MRDQIDLDAMNRAAILALVSAALFGMSTPAAKGLLGSVDPAVLAGLLYCGAGIGVATVRRFFPLVVSGAPEAKLTRSEMPWLAGAIGVGGVLGPLLLMKRGELARQRKTPPKRGSGDEVNDYCCGCAGEARWPVVVSGAGGARFMAGAGVAVTAG